jgi:hypothetical protein
MRYPPFNTKTTTRCRAMAVLAVVVMLAFTPPGSSRAQNGALVDVALVLAVDSSASVDFNEFNLQLQGLALAFRDPQLAHAIAEGANGTIAVSMMEWSGADQQRLSIPWTRIGSETDAQAFADRIDAAPRLINTGATSISSAILFGSQLLKTAPFFAVRQVIDLSGDGYNNQGPALSVTRDHVIDQGITINALGIENQVLGLTDYFREALIGGFGAFAIKALDYQDYKGQIRRKLLRELAPPPVSALPPRPMERTAEAF